MTDRIDGGRLLDKQGHFAHKKHFISVASGLQVDPLDLQVEDINYTDIARALSRQCRYNGHVGGFLSVARHCIWVAERLRETSPKHELWGLLHDADETYLGDMVRPLKTTDEMKPFVDAGDRALGVIACRFGLEWPMPKVVLEADSWVLTELELPDFRQSWITTPMQDESDWLHAYYKLTA